MAPTEWTKWEAASEPAGRMATFARYVGYMVAFFILATLVTIALLGGLLVVLASVNAGPPPGG